MADTQQDPIRLRIGKAISDALREITPENGYKTNLDDRAKWDAGQVFRGRLTFGDDDPLPMVSILEVPQPAEQQKSGQMNPNTLGPWELIIQGFTDDDEVNPTDPAHVLMADVKQRIAQEKIKKQRGDHNLFGIKAISDIQLSPGVVRPPDDASAKAYFWLLLTVILVEDNAHPYA